MKANVFLKVVFSLIIVFAFANISQGDNINLVSATNATNDWHTSATWDRGVPGPDDNVYIQNGSNNWAMISSDDVELHAALKVRYTDGLILSNRTLRLTADVAPILEWGAGGTYRQIGADSELICKTSRVDGGTFILEGGSVTVSNDFECGYNDHPGYYYQYGGTNTIKGSFTFKRGTVEISGGLLVYSNSISVGTDDTATFNLKGGKVGFVNMTVGPKSSTTSYYNQSGGTNQVSGSFWIGTSGVGDVTISGGKLATGNMLLAPNVGGGSFEVRGNTAEITTGDIDADNGHAATIKFVLAGKAGGVSPIQCSSQAKLNNANLTVAWDVADDFSGIEGATYDLFTTGSGVISGCVFTNLTDIDFSIALIDGDKKLRLTLNENYPKLGTLIFIQ